MHDALAITSVQALCFIFHMLRGVCLLYIPFFVLKYSGDMKSCSHIDDRTCEGRCSALRACRVSL